MDIEQPSVNWNDPCLADEWKRSEKHLNLIFGGPLSGKTEKSMCTYLLI